MVASAAEHTGRGEVTTTVGGTSGAGGLGEDREGGLLLTGATGFVGMELLARYLERTDRRVYALVRGADDREVAARVEHTLSNLFGEVHAYRQRVIGIRGDVTRPDLGLDDCGAALAEHVGEVVHGAASVSFDLGLE